MTLLLCSLNNKNTHEVEFLFNDRANRCWAGASPPRKGEVSVFFYTSIHTFLTSYPPTFVIMYQLIYFFRTS